MKKQAGFTLIELISVIVILGILSAFALPRFADLENEARAASIEGLGGAIRSASALAHAVWLARGANGNSVLMEGAVPVTVDANTGYPTATANGIVAALQENPVNSGYALVTTPAPPANTIIYSPVNSTTPASCQVSYNAGTNPPTIIVVSTNCR